jgi:ankyrin repeat protein
MSVHRNTTVPSRAPAHTKPLSKTGMLSLVKAHDYATVSAVLKANRDALAYRGKKGENLLHICCGVRIGKDAKRRTASVRTARALIDAGIDVDEEAFREGQWRATPLWYAIGRGKNFALAAYLLERGASPEHCMWAAAYNDDAAAVRLLCDAGANVDPVDVDTPLMFAVKWSRFAAARALLERGANPNFQDANGKTALHYMVKKRCDPKYFRMFAEHGARSDLADCNGKTVYDLVSRFRDPRFRAALEFTP